MGVNGHSSWGINCLRVKCSKLLEGGAVQLLLTDGSSYEVAGIPQLLLSAELLAVADSSRDENEVAATTFDALVEEGFGDTLEETVTQSDTVIDQALEDIFSEELEATAAGGAAGAAAVQAQRSFRPTESIRKVAMIVSMVSAMWT